MMQHSCGGCIPYGVLHTFGIGSALFRILLYILLSRAVRQFLLVSNSQRWYGPDI